MRAGDGRGRIVEEALTNVQLHSGADEVEVRLATTEGHVVLDVPAGTRGPALRSSRPVRPPARGRYPSRIRRRAISASSPGW